MYGCMCPKKLVCFVGVVEEILMEFVCSISHPQIFSCSLKKKLFCPTAKRNDNQTSIEVGSPDEDCRFQTGKTWKKIFCLQLELPEVESWKCSGQCIVSECSDGS